MVKSTGENAEPETAEYTSLAAPELELNTELKNLSDRLETPLKIYEYVKNTMDYKMYYGSRYGAKGTYCQQAGNDYDQASLLIAMLRYKGYEARYVSGTIQLDIDKAMNLTGAKTPKAAVDTISMLGVPTGYMTSGGKITAVRAEHTWVEVKIPYDDYRGAGNLKGEGEWIPLDPSYKMYEENEAAEIAEITGYSEKEIKDSFQMTGKETEYGKTLLKAEKMQDLLEKAEQNIESYVEAKDIDSKKAKELTGERKIKKKKRSASKRSPYRVIEKRGEYDTIPKEATAEITLALTENFYGSYFMDIQT